MVEVAIDQEMIDFDLFHDFDFNLNELEPYLNHENRCHEDKLCDSSNTTINCLVPLSFLNNDSNQVLRQWPPKDIQYQYNANRFDANFNGIQDKDRANTSLTDPYFGSAHSIGEQHYYHNQVRNDTISDHFSAIPYNDFNSNNNRFHQTIDNPLPETLAEPAANQSQVEDLPEPVIQFNGQLLSTEEFQMQNESDLFCEEQMADNSLQSKLDSGANFQSQEQSPPTPPTQPLIIETPIDDNQNHNKTVIVNNTLSSNCKTYSRVLKPITDVSTANGSDMSRETIAAVKGLVMLSNNYRQTVIRTKIKKVQQGQLTFAERQRQKRERNRIAAKKCRQKKLETIEKLEVMKEILAEENQKHESTLKIQRQKLFDLKVLLIKHRLTDCRLKDI